MVIEDRRPGSTAWGPRTPEAEERHWKNSWAFIMLISG